MMAADVNLQVWLETIPNTHPSVVVPYIKSQENGQFEYTLKAIKQGRSGSSSVGQSGDIIVNANQPTELSRFSLSLGKDDQCRIELILIKNGHPAGTYHFECPR